MLDRTSAFAELSQRALTAVGSETNSLSHPFSLVTLIEIEATNWRSSGNSWETDVEPDILRLATLTHAEMATDRYCRQIASVLTAISESRDPHWAAVTCYYAALYAAQALQGLCVVA